MNTDRQKLRDDILYRAGIGEITGEQADEEAERLGVGRFSRTPDQAVFNPMHERFWTLPMVLAWVAYRSPDEVREHWYRYCEKCWHWIWSRWRNGPDGDINEGWHLEQRHRPNVAMLTLGSASDRNDPDAPAMVMSVTAARDELWEIMKENTLTANGLDERTGTYVDVPAVDWHQLVSTTSSGDEDELRLGSLGRGYKNVLFHARAIRTLWPPAIPERTPLPAQMSPSGDGYMPLYFVAQWIATEGGKRDFDPEDELPWRAAYDALMNAATAEKLRIIGTRDGLREPVPGYSFAGCRVEYPFRVIDAPLLQSHDLFLRSYPYLDDPSWHGGICDSLVRRHDHLWSKLLVSKEDVRKLWPFDLSTERSGAPGRPTSMHLIKGEFERRVATGQLEPTLAAQANALVAWLEVVHSLSPRLTPGTIQNNIRDRYRILKATK